MNCTTGTAAARVEKKGCDPLLLGYYVALELTKMRWFKACLHDRLKQRRRGEVEVLNCVRRQAGWLLPECTCRTDLADDFLVCFFAARWKAKTKELQVEHGNIKVEQTEQRRSID